MEAIFGLIGVAVGIIGTYLFSLRLLREQELIKARSNFRCSILPIVIAIEEDVDFIPTVIQKGILDQETSFWYLLAQIPKNQRIKFFNTWQEYAYPNKKEFPEKPRLEYDYTSPEEKKEVFKKLLIRINKMMKFA